MLYTIEEIKEKVQPIALTYHLPAVYLFGSYARGEADEKSDVDLAVELSDESDFFDVYCAIKNLFGDDVDVLSLSDVLNPATYTGQLVKKNFMKERLLLL